MCNGYWFSHHIDFTSVSALIIWFELTEFQREIISETHPIILANDQSSCRQHSFLLLPHEDICAQIGNLAWQYQTFTNLSTENLVMTQYLRTGLSSFFHKVFTTNNLRTCKRKSNYLREINFLFGGRIEILCCLSSINADFFSISCQGNQGG